MIMDTLTIYTDGASRGNPGPAAAAAIFYRGGKIINKKSALLGEKTNNQAEYEALIMALKEAKKILASPSPGRSGKARTVSCFLDSELVVRQLNHKYKIKDEKIVPLFIKVWNLSLDFDVVKFSHIPREKNREADDMANRLLDEKKRNGLL